MARINIEESLFKRSEFHELIIKLGSAELALGCLVRCWSVAQKFWVPDKKLIPTEVWKKEKLRNEIIDVGLAEVIGEEIYVKGSKQSFEWLFKVRENGKKGGKTRAENASNLNKDSSSHGLVMAKQELSESKPLYSLLSTPTLNYNTSNNIINNIIPPTCNFENDQSIENVQVAGVLQIEQSNSLANLPSVQKPKALSTKKNKDPVRQTYYVDNVKQLISFVEENQWEMFIKLYPDKEYIHRQLHKAILWLSTNPKKNWRTKRGWVKCVGTFLHNDWEKWIKSQPSNPAAHISTDQIMSILDGI